MPEADSVAHGLRLGSDVSDAHFDRIYPEWIQKISQPHWTPIKVARRAAEMLVSKRHRHILDVGSGPGKFCLVGALVTQATFVGVEQRKNLVDIATGAAKRCGASRARFIHDNMMSIDWSEFDGIYLFNPFYEQIADGIPRIEGPIETSADLYTQYVVTTCVKLFTAREGTRVVTYHGFGGPMPTGYQLITREPACYDYLELWEKV